MSDRGPSAPADRRVFLKTFCAGSFLCLGCDRLQAATGGQPQQPTDAFQADSRMSFKDVWAFAYAHGSVPLLKALGEDLGRERLVEMVKAASARTVDAAVRKQAPPAPGNTLDAFVADTLNPDSWFWRHVVSLDVVEKTASALEVRVKRCLWAQTFRDAQAADFGYAMVCHTDFAAAPAFNPGRRMTRTKTLMQGDDHCNHRWVVEA